MLFFGPLKNHLSLFLYAFRFRCQANHILFWIYFISYPSYASFNFGLCLKINMLFFKVWPFLLAFLHYLLQVLLIFFSNLLSTMSYPQCMWLILRTLIISRGMSCNSFSIISIYKLNKSGEKTRWFGTPLSIFGDSNRCLFAYKLFVYNTDCRLLILIF